MGLELVEYGRYKKRLMDKRYEFSNQCGPLQLMFLEAPSNCTSTNGCYEML